LRRNTFETKPNNTFSDPILWFIREKDVLKFLHMIAAKILNICLNINTTMGFKTLTIKESVYKKLILMKKENESFSDLFERLSTSNLEILKKLQGRHTYEDKEEFLQEIYEKRKEKRYR